ncbi:hypothetical protein [Iodidimonas sp. SYSU 1G8]|uniref:hypothetical protein n=1 Tax=Iodidimonas sp. SYSU 1G8 TaxID=3133967 RepID=UPI0031FF3E5A
MRTVAVCVPARDMVHTAFAFDLARAVAFHTAHSADKVLLFQSMGTLICNQRQELAREAMAAGADWILYLDTDMRFPKDTIVRLLAHGVPVVAANYATRRTPVQPVAFRQAGLSDRVQTGPQSTGLEPVFAVGMGVFLVKADVMAALPLPWFQIGWSPGLADFVGEDMHFCRLLGEHGTAVVIDHDLSKEVRHLGGFEYDVQHAWLLREPAELEIE